MNTKLLMSTSSVLLALAGATCQFLPQEILAAAAVPSGPLQVVTLQLLGALYLALATLNWTARGVMIGGIYARPVSFANFMHFAIGSIVLARLAMAGWTNATAIAGLAVYATLAALFTYLLFAYKPGAGVTNSAK